MNKKSLIFVAIQAFVVVFGLIMTGLLVDYGRHEFRLDLVYHARIAASSFSAKQVIDLVNSSQENRKSACEPVWNQLHQLQQAIPQLRYIYLMYRVDGQVYFLADTDNPPCYDYSDESGIYTEASVELQNVFVTGQPFVEGPLADQWGNWVSGIAPIIDPQSGQVIAVLGVDIDAEVYQAKIATYRVFGLVATLLAGLVVLAFQLIYRRIRSSRDRQTSLNFCLTDEISKRQDFEKALAESENWFRSIFANTAAGVVTVSFKRKFLKGNPAFCQMIGYSETEIEQLSQRDITYPDDRESSEKIYCDVVRDKPDRFEIVKRYVCKDGSIVWVQITGSWIYDGENPIHAVLLVLDITERKRIDDELRVQKELLDNVINHVPSSIFWKDCDLVYLGCNQALADQAGLDHPSIIAGKSDYDLPWKKEEADFFRSCDKQVIDSKQPMLDIEESQQQVGGRQATLLTSKVPLMDRDGEVVGLLGIFTDITERKQFEEDLKKSEQDYRLLSQQFQGLLNAIPDTIMLISTDMNIIWANHGAMNQFPGCKSLETRHCFSAWQGRDHPCEDCPVQRCFESGDHEEQLIHGNDGRIWAVRAYPLKDEQGKVVNVIDICSDISEKIRLRNEADRNSRLASLGELAAGVAHEINNPNGLILINTPMLHDVLNDALPLFDDYYHHQGQLELGGLDYQELRDELPLMVQRIEGGAKRIKRIVEDLKNFVRQGEVDLSDQLDLNEVVRTSIRLVDNSIKRATDHFETDFGSLPLGRGDFQRIEQVVVNLIQNACLALTDRTSRVRLVTYFDAEKKCNILQVHDEGVGIDQQALPHVTDPFYTTRRQSGGTGLGLSVSARIIREHGGQLEFQSTLGVGTVVTMELPVAGEGESA